MATRPAIRFSTARGECAIHFGDWRANLAGLHLAGRSFYVTDEAVGVAGLPAEAIALRGGEEIKDLEHLAGLYQRFIDLGVRRDDWIVAIGGGTISDLVGLAASTYLRGVNFAFVPTTLLSQADGSIGGKNGVNFGGLKNMVGTFNQPRHVLIDVAFLASLDERAYRSGLAEIVKHAAIRDAALWDFMEARAEAIAAREPECLDELVAASAAVKVAIVAEDVLEQGARRLLNFGHTFGHAFELEHHLTHGEAVALGMVVAARISTELGRLPAGDADRLVALLDALGLPTDPPPVDARAIAALGHDKKRTGEGVHFVVLDALGRGVTTPLSPDELFALCRRLDMTP